MSMHGISERVSCLITCCWCFSVSCENKWCINFNAIKLDPTQASTVLGVNFKKVSVLQVYMKVEVKLVLVLLQLE